jgi:aerobic carbon-monoxide dehydrogenase large subunit
VGQGVRTALGQIAADALRVPLDHVRVTHHDTDVVPEGMGAFGSRTTTLGGNAVLGAVRDLEQRARTVAAARLAVDPGDLEIAAGRVAPVDRPHDALDLATLGVEGSHRYESPGTGVAMGANAVVAELDAATGGVRVRSCSLAYDVGRAVNPAMVMGQLIGGAAQGIGGALLEELAYDAAGQPLAASFMDYLLPTAADVPPLSPIVLELGEPTASNPLALHGCGEGGIVGVGAAVANAVADATGADVTELPLNPATVAELLAHDSRENPRPSRGIHT